MYKVRNLIDRQQYALKVIELDRDEVGPAMREVQCLAAISSPRILRYYSSWLEEDLPGDKMSLYIQTEFVSGRTLREVLDSRRELNVDFAKHVVRELALALTDIHEVGIVHRDFNPSNVLVSRDGSVKVIDFGISSWRKCEEVVDEEPLQTGSLPERLMNPIDEFCVSEVEKARTWREVGTPMYSSPRQLCGHDAAAADDVFSFGVMIAEVFSEFRTTMEKVKVVRDLRKGILPGDFEEKWPRISELVKSMVHSDPDLRPSASDIIESGLFEAENTDL